MSKVETVCECCAELKDCVEVEGLSMCQKCVDEFQEKHQSEKTRAEKIADKVRDYAHDYRNLSLDEDNFRVMLQDFLAEIAKIEGK